MEAGSACSAHDLWRRHSRQRAVVLVSRLVQQELLSRGASVETIASNAGEQLDPRTLRRVDAAFLSMDLVATSAGPCPRPDLEAFFDHLRKAENLRWLHVCSAGTDRPVFSELAGRGVRLTTSSGANAPEVSQTALAGFLALARGVPEWLDAQRRHEWVPLTDNRPPRDIAGQTAVVVGMGAIGREIARLLHAFRLSVIGVSRSGVPVPGCAEVVTYARIQETLRRADWLFLACPLTRETHGMIDAAGLRLLPQGARIINVARGAVVVESDLVSALRSGRLGGAYLDVFETEPLPVDSPLWDLPGVLISAHRAGLSSGVHGRTLEMFLANLQRWTEGAELRNEVGRTPAR